MNPTSPSTHAEQQEQQALMELLSHSILRYAERDGTQPLIDWLAHSLEQEGQLAPQAAHSLASDFIAHIGRSHQLRSELQQHQQQKKSRASWLAGKIEQIAARTGASPMEVATATALFSDQPTGAEQHSSNGSIKREWNSITRLQLAQELEQSQQHQAAQSLLQQVQGLIHEQEWLQQSPKASQLVENFLEGKLKVTDSTALQAALAAATDIAARKGMLGTEFQKELEAGHIGPEWFAKQSFTGTEVARIVYAVGSGQLTSTEAINQITETGIVAAVSAAEPYIVMGAGVVGGFVADFIFKNPIAKQVGSEIGQKIGQAVCQLARKPVQDCIRQGAETVKMAVVQTVNKILKKLSNPFTLNLSESKK